MCPYLGMWLWGRPTGQALEVGAYFISDGNYFTSEYIHMNCTYVCMWEPICCLRVRLCAHCHTKNVCLFVVKVELINLSAQSHSHILKISKTCHIESKTLIAVFGEQYPTAQYWVTWNKKQHTQELHQTGWGLAVGYTVCICVLCACMMYAVALSLQWPSCPNENYSISYGLHSS